MAKQKRILDLTEGHIHIQCIRTDSDNCNPYHVYLVTSVTGAPLRRRLLIKYGDYMSVLYFLTQFFRDGLDTMAYCDMVEYIRARTI